MKEERPLISVIIPVYNGEAFLAEAIQSVLNQNFLPIEIVVVDDGSTDNTKQIALGFGDQIIYTKKENGGVASARNRGIELAKGDFIAFIDADDLWLLNKTETQISILENPGIEIVIGFTQMMALDKDVQRMQLNPEPMLIYQLGSTMIRKSVFEIIGNFDETMILSEDTDWFFRAMEAGISIELHKDVVQYYRIHQANLTADKKKNIFFLLKAHKKSLDRRRAAGKGSIKGFQLPNNLEKMIKFRNSIK